ncbi:MAG TPA: CehA/McbA family metallohydrolase [Kofleriaceae bacterium]|nr:CehA/McbA family metallohydrolase [Kofleriaceae bacterium]
MLALLAVIGTMHFEADVHAGDGDYDLVTFDVPAGTQEIQVDHTDGSDTDILDWGVWSPEGFRGWGGGLTDPAIIGVQASSRGYLPGAITPGTWTVVVGEAKLPTGTGHYVIDVTFRDAPTLAPQTRAPFAPVVVKPGARWYRGDFHVHDTESGDAKASIADVIALARSRGLDFVELSDHNTDSQLGLQAVAQQSLTDLLLLRGVEVTTYHGHGNALGATDYIDHRVGLGGVDAASIVAAAHQQGALFFVNHPVLDLGDVCIGCAWKQDVDWSQVAGLEIQNGNVTVSEVLFTPQAIKLWDQILDGGAKVAAIGGSDDHTAGVDETNTGSPIGSPTTLVYATELSEAAIKDAVAHGRTQVLIPGPDLPAIDLTIATPTGDARIGDTATGISHVELTATLEGAAPADATLGIWRDGEKIDQIALDGAGADFSHVFHYDAQGGLERFRAEMVSGGLRVVVTSHVWVDGTKPAPEGCGCRASTSLRPNGILAAAVAMALARRRRRARRP